MATFVPGRDPADAIVQDSFIDGLVSELDEVGYAIRDEISLLSGADWRKARREAETRRSAMADATISEGMTNVAEKSKRSDRVEFISVVKPEHLTSLREASPNLYAHVSWIEILREKLEKAFDLGMEKSTFMLAEYPGGGTKYVKHRDAAPSPYAGRKITAIYYLNTFDTSEGTISEAECSTPCSGVWHKDLGGELKIWPCAKEDLFPEEPGGEPRPSNKPAVDIEPRGDRLVVFRSSLEHEVGATFFSRMAITAWFVNKRHMALELLCEQLSLKQEAQQRDLDAVRANTKAAMRSAQDLTTEAMAAATIGTTMIGDDVNHANTTDIAHERTDGSLGKSEVDRH